MSSELTRDGVMKAVFPALDGFAPSTAPASHAAKRAFDLLLGTALLLLFTPVMMLVSLAVALESPGPVLFCQKRTGQHGRTFPIFKFRSMRVMEKGGEVRQAVEGDDRITRVGRIIRKLSLDELPQLFNVIAGQMSLVGPRPHAILHDEFYGTRIAGYALRQQVKPGITGWAQVNYPYGASIEDAKRKLAYDLYYVKRNEVFLDFTILIQTVRVILFAQGAR